jgi:hypothetical protein
MQCHFLGVSLKIVWRKRNNVTSQCLCSRKKSQLVIYLILMWGNTSLWWFMVWRQFMFRKSSGFIAFKIGSKRWNICICRFLIVQSNENDFGRDYWHDMNNQKHCYKMYNFVAIFRRNVNEQILFLCFCCYKSQFNLCYVYRLLISWNVTHFVISLM